MFDFLKIKKDIVLGVDISSTAVKVVELSGSDGDYTIENYGIEPLPAGAVQEKNISDMEKVGDALERVLKKSRIRLKNGAAAVSSASVIIKHLELPADMSDKELYEQVYLEAEQIIPFPLEEVSIDYEIQGEGVNETVIDVLLVACKQETVDAKVEVLQIADITAKVIDIESYALERAAGVIIDGLSGSSEDKVVAICDIGETITTINIMQHGSTIYTRDQMFGGKQLTEEISNRFNLSSAEAEKAKKTSELPSEYEQDVLSSFRESVANQISRALQFFFAQGDYQVVDYVLLAGGTSAIPGLADAVEEKVGTTTKVVNPFASMSVGSRVNRSALVKDAPALMVACGLALRSFE